MVAESNELKAGCLQVLSYFGIFSYPLTLQEIHRFNTVRATEEETKYTLNELIREGRVFQDGSFFLPENNAAWVQARTRGNDRAQRLLETSGKYVAVIAGFPFVRGMAISGSLSKYYASENPDIDFFIITDPDRLWIARSLLHLFKKLTFITGQQHFYCMNYFVDTKALEITHPNLYSAVEVTTLLPVFNIEILRQFFIANAWTREFLPNHPGMTDLSYLLTDRKHRLKKMMEWMINRCFPLKINKWLMKLTDWKWRRKWKRNGYPSQEYDRAFLTTIHVSKNHPVDYEKKVLDALSKDRQTDQPGL